PPGGRSERARRAPGARAGGARRVRGGRRRCAARWRPAHALRGVHLATTARAAAAPRPPPRPRRYTDEGRTHMKVREIMTPEPATCTPQTSLQDVAKLMVEHDCGAIPVVDQQGKPIGIVTDRDIVCRTVAAAKNPLQEAAEQCMSSPVATVSEESSV